MPVYVDDALIPFGRMLMSHMVADTHAELVEMADRLGIARKWIQNAGLAREHFDISKGHRDRAIAYGAIPISTRELAVKLQARKGERSLGFTPEAKTIYFGAAE